MLSPCLLRLGPHTQSTPTPLPPVRRRVGSRSCCMRWRSCGGKTSSPCIMLVLALSRFALITLSLCWFCCWCDVACLDRSHGAQLT